MSDKVNKIDNAINYKEVFFIGLAFFATYFGAGNLIFPPFLGLETGNLGVSGAIGLTTSGIFLPIVALIMLGFAGSIHSIAVHVHEKFATIIVASIMIFATFVSIPRTGAIGIELGLQSIFSQAPYVAAVAVYFILALYFSYQKESVLDKIGKYLTPIMVICLLLVVIRGVMNPVGVPQGTGIKNSFFNSFLGGYQTGDLLVSFMMADFFLNTCRKKGYTSRKQLGKVNAMACVVAFVCLLIIYGGLYYLGAGASGQYLETIGRTDLLIDLVRRVGGGFLMSILGVAVVLACLTTATGQISAVSDFFERESKGRLSYKSLVIGVSILSCLIAFIGVDNIVKFTNPLFTALYAPLLGLTILGFFGKWIPNDGFYKGSIFLTSIYSISEAINEFTGSSIGFLDSFVTQMPLAGQGFGWIIPFVVGLIIGGILYPRISGNKELIN
ncbi:MAG: branched-chain amino acid transport system II carrier protein [Tissierella sp.]|uniref:branched-chain amino acid transport system II carrier protein n=1 Tax=Tissierella sp. TaxID=41274 RepID=UPI003F9D0AE8